MMVFAKKIIGCHSRESGNQQIFYRFWIISFENFRNDENSKQWLI